MKSSALITSVIAVLIFSQSAIAADHWHTSKLYSIYPNANGVVVLQFLNNAPDCTGTDPYKYHYLAIGWNSVTADGLKNILAIATAAFAMDATVKFNYSSDTSQCYINRLLVIR